MNIPRFLIVAFFLITSYCFSQTNQRADSLYQIALKAADKDQSNLLLQAAEAYQNTNQKKAIAVAKEAINQAKDTATMAKGELYIGRFYYFGGEHDSALQRYLTSLSLYKKINNKIGQANVLNEIGTLVKKQGYLQKSADYFREGLELSKQAGDSAQIANSMNNLGIALEMMGQLEQAMQLYRESADIKRKLKDFYGLSYNLDNMGMLLTTMKQYAEAEKSFGEAAAIRKQSGDRRGYGIILNNMGEMWQVRNNDEQALRYFYDALQIAEETHYADFRNHLYNVLSGVYADQKDFEKALFFYRKHVSLKDSIFNEQKSRQLLEMETKYETEKKEQEISIQNLVINEQKLKLSRNQFFIIGLGLLLLLSVFTFLLWRSQQVLKEQKIVEETQRKHQEDLTKAVIQLQEKERSRFAKDLHDGFGQLITALKMQIEKVGLRTDGIPEVIQHMHDEIRNVSFALSPQVLVRDGLVQAIKELTFRINRTNAITITVQTTGLTERLSEDYEIALYRVCQEWINNVMKYSGADRVEIQLIEHDDEITLMIEDNGKGFDPSLLEKSMGNGWKNIQSRVQILKGEVEVDSSPSRNGNTFTANIPKQSRAEMVMA